MSFGTPLTDYDIYTLSDNFSKINNPNLANADTISAMVYNTTMLNNEALNYLNTKDSLIMSDTTQLFIKIRNLNYLSQMHKEFLCAVFINGLQANDNMIIAEYFTGVEDIINNSALSTTDKKILLSGLSVGRASANYWHDVNEGNR